MDENKYVRREWAVVVDILRLFSVQFYIIRRLHTYEEWTVGGRFVTSGVRMLITWCQILSQCRFISILFLGLVLNAFVLFGRVCVCDVRKTPFIAPKSIFF